MTAKKRVTKKTRKQTNEDEETKPILSDLGTIQIRSELDTVTSLQFPINEPKFKSEKQKQYVDLIRNDSTRIVLCKGVAGTAKTYLSVFAALKLLKKGSFERIIYVRSAAESSDTSLGYLPGSVGEKISEYMVPLKEKLIQFITVDVIKELSGKHYIEGISNNFLRGRSIEKSIIIADECQNFSYRDLVTLTTRVEDDVKLILLGDPMQSDIGRRSGFSEFIDMFEGRDEENTKVGLHTFEFGHEDIHRGELCKYILRVISEHQKD